MKLYLMQHGKAMSKEENPERPLTDQGKDDVGRVSKSIAQAEIQLSEIRHSGKRRAEDTANIVAQHLNLQDKVNYVMEKAKELEEYFQDESRLYDAANSMEKKVLMELKQSYEIEDTKIAAQYFGPVNIVRVKIINFLVAGTKIDKELIDEIKEKFLNKDIAYFSDFSKEHHRLLRS